MQDDGFCGAKSLSIFTPCYCLCGLHAVMMSTNSSVEIRAFSAFDTYGEVFVGCSDQWTVPHPDMRCGVHPGGWCNVTRSRSLVSRGKKAKVEAKIGQKNRYLRACHDSGSIIHGCLGRAGRDIHLGYVLHPVYLSSTSRILYSNIRFEGTECSFCNLSADSAPAAGTRYSNLLPGAGTDPSGRAYGKGRYSGMRPNCTSAVAWSHAMCS